MQGLSLISRCVFPRHAPLPPCPHFAAPADDGRYVGVTQWLRSYMQRVHAPLLRRPAVKAGVLAVFIGVFLVSCAALPRLDR